MRAAQQVGEVLGLGPLGVEGEHLDAASPVPVPAGHASARGSRNAVARLRVDGAGQRELGGDPLGGPQDRGPNRRVVGSATTSARLPSVPERRGKSRIPRTSAPRNA